MERTKDNINFQVKNNIKLLIEAGEREGAKELLQQYKKMVPEDIEIYSMEAILEIINGNLDKSVEAIKEGLFIDGNNVDLLYNLAYVQEIKGDFNKALKYYDFAYRVSDEKMKITIKKTMENLIKNNNISFDIEEYFKSNKSNEQSKRILILCNFYSPYMKGYMEKIKEKYNVIFDVFTVSNEDDIRKNGYYKFVESGIINKLHTYEYSDELNNLINSMNKYDVIHIHYLELIYHYVINTIRNKCKTLITTIWGSDFYRKSDKDKILQKEIINNSDLITFDNEVVKDEFIKYFGENLRSRCTINRFGLTALEHINDIESISKEEIKAELQIPSDAIVVQCGYNARPTQNHLQMIDSIISVKNKLPKNMFYIFPMTYGEIEDYMTQVKNKLERSGLNYKIIEDFMQFDDIAKLTKCTDIMVHLQTTDTLSATMQEHIYNGNVIITGSWFPYKPLKDVGTYFIEVNAINKLGNKLADVVNNLNEYKSKCINNKEVIWKFSSWNKTANEWIKNYEQKHDGLKDINVFNHRNYWNNRYSYKYDLETSGYMGLGTIYNKYLYKSRLDVLKTVIKNIYGDLKNKKVLEVGPGTGYFSEYFYKCNLKGYLGIDISDVAIDNLNKKFKKFNFKVGDISHKESFDTNKYDLVFGSDVLLHLTEKDKFNQVINNIKSCLKDLGYYLAIEPVIFSDNFEEQSEHNKLIEIEELKEVLNDNGLELVDCIPVTFFMDYPFDHHLIENLGVEALNAFNNILSCFQNENWDNTIQEKLSREIYEIDKQYLLEYKAGFSNKFLVIRKAGNYNYNKIDINKIWSKGYGIDVEDGLYKAVSKKLYSNIINGRKNIHKLPKID